MRFNGHLLSMIQGAFLSPQYLSLCHFFLLWAKLYGELFYFKVFLFFLIKSQTKNPLADNPKATVLRFRREAAGRDFVLPSPC